VTLESGPGSKTSGRIEVRLDDRPKVASRGTAYLAPTIRARSPSTATCFRSAGVDGDDFTGLPLRERKLRLKKLIGRRGAAACEGNAAETFKHAYRLSLEGIVPKQADSLYRADRSTSWRKIKNRKPRRQGAY
jgi:ATP-dependent DNA ligase